MIFFSKPNPVSQFLEKRLKFQKFIVPDSQGITGIYLDNNNIWNEDSRKEVKDIQNLMLNIIDENNKMKIKVNKMEEEKIKMKEEINEMNEEIYQKKITVKKKN